jgi:hypothetical protein
MSLLYVRATIPECQGERLLLAAILRRACFDIALYRATPDLKRRKIWKEAYQWMFTDDEMGLHPDDRFTSFLNICTLLDQDPATIRRKTLKLTRKDVKKFEMVDTHGRLH